MPTTRTGSKRIHNTEWYLVLVCGLLITVIIAGILVLACVPPVSRDALTHHLAVPKLYLEQGSMHEIPGCVFSYYPMNLDLLYMIPLALGNDIIPKYIHLAFALLTAAWLFRYLKKELNTLSGMLGALLFLSIPVIIKLSITVYVDLGLIFFSTAALLICLEWRRSGFRNRYLLMAAVFCGLALGTKYNGLITFFLLTMLIPFAYAAGKRKKGVYRIRALMYAVLFAFVALLVFSPWMIKNFIWTGNPVFPLFDSLFHGQVADASQDTRDAVAAGSRVPMDHFSLRKNVYNESVAETATIPIRIFFQGRDDNPKYFDGILNPYLFFLPLAWVGLAGREAFKNRSAEFYMGVFALLYLLFVFFREDMRIRWIAPIIPPLVILSVHGFNEIMRFLERKLHGTGLIIARIGCVLMLGALLALNFNYLASQFRRVAPLAFISGRESRVDYISRYRPAYKLHAYAGRHLPANAKILGQFLGNRRYYSQREIVFEDHILKELVGRYRAANVVGAKLAQSGITHLMIRLDLFDKWVGDNFGQADLEILQTFFREHLSLMQGHSGYALYKLR